MAAIVSGSSLGLLNSSLYVLGSQGALGQANTGRASEQVYVNSDTGNLVIQNRDELLVGRGPDIGILRTYNSQGLLDGDNNDNWRIGVYRKVTNLTGTVNTAGSTVTRVAEDGSESVYAYDTTLTKYVCHEGAGSYDTLSFDSPSQTWTWSWTDGTTHLTERYDAANGGRLTQVLDQDSNGLPVNGLSFTYNAAGLITRVDDASGETTFLDYSGTDLTQLRTVISTSTGQQTLIRTRYAYDPSHRLIQVTTDLSPEDTSVSDGNTYVVNYTYDGGSRRVATLTQTDGNNLSFTYVQVGADYRVSSVTDALNRVTTFTFNNAPVVVSEPGTSANQSALVTTDTQSTTVTRSLDASQLLTTNPTQYGLNSSLLQNTDAVPYALNSPQLQTTDTVPYALNSSLLQTTDLVPYTLGPALTAPGPGAVTNGGGSSYNSALGLDSSGNGFNVSLSGTSVLASRYANSAWGGPFVLATNAASIPNLQVDASGNAIVTFTTTLGVFAIRYMNGAWQAAEKVNGSASFAVGTTGSAPTSGAISANGSRAVVTWQGSDGKQYSSVSSGFNTWSLPVVVASGPVSAHVTFQQAAITTSGTAFAISTSGSLVVAAGPGSPTHTFGTADSGSPIVPQIATDAQGNAIALWASGGTLFGARWTDSSGWGAAIPIAGGLGVSSSPYRLSVDASGNAIAVWQSADGNARAARFVGGVWQAPELIGPAGSGISQIAGSINGRGEAVVLRASSQQLMRRYDPALQMWAPDVVVAGIASTQLRVGIDSLGVVAGSFPGFLYEYDFKPYYVANSGDTWASIATTVYGSANVADELQAALGNVSITAGRHLAGFPTTLNDTVSAPPYYRVQAGDTYASIATALYGSANVGDELQAALGNVALTAGVHLTGLPSTLNDTVAVAPYYRIQAGDTYASIAAALYGSSNVGDELQAALGNVALTAGVHLTGLPSTLNDTVAVAPYYRIQAGDTYASIAAALYGSANVGDELQAAFGSGPLLAGQRLSGLPATLTDTVTVAPYYSVKAGDTWSSIGTLLYGNGDIAVELQAAMGNPTLAQGLHLSNPPATLTHTGLTPVPPYYLVRAGDTWSSIAQAVYGSAAAGFVLQAALGNPALTPGAHLTVPAVLNYSTASANNALLSTTETQTTTTTVAPYYMVASGDTWTSITQAVYGTSNANAVSALQTALGNPALTAGTRLTVPQTLNYNTGVTASANSAVLSTTTTTTVAPYYTVASGNTWTSITQTVYGTSNANAVAALQSALGNPALTVGTRLTVPQTLTYNVSTMSSANSAVLSTTDTQTTNYSLNSGALTNPAGGWTGPAALESSGAAASSLLMNASNTGAATAVWLQGGSLYASVYDNDTQQWSAAVVVSGSFTNISGVQLDVDYNYGNAVVTWIDATTGKVYANRCIRAGGFVDWTGAQLVATASGTLAEAVGAINAWGTSAVVWRAVSGSTQTLMVSRWNGSAWGAAEQVTTGNVAITAPQMTCNQDDVFQVVWRASDGTAESLFTRGYAGAWGATTVLDSSSVPVSLFRVDGDVWGDTNVTWVQGNDLNIKWGGEEQGWGGEIVEATSPSPISQYAYSDSDNNNMVAWITTDGKVYANRWGSSGPDLIATGTGLSDISADINVFGDAVVSWRAGNDLYVSSFTAATWWSTPVLLEPGSGAATTPRVAIDQDSRQIAVWVQNDGTANSIFASRFAAGGGTGSPYYTVQANDSWGNIAQLLYGSSAAGSALQTALGNPALTAGAQLTAFPATLSVTSTVTVPAYYVVPSGASWTTVTQAVYGTSNANAVAALQTATGNPALTTGLHLTVPSSITYNVSTTSNANNAVLSTTITTTVAPYYTVTSTDTWTSITQTVYGTSNANAVAALQSSLGNPTLSNGLHLTVPATLSYNVATSTNANNAVLSTTITTTTTTTVAPYYAVQSGDTWASIAQTVYGDAQAGSALQASLNGAASPTAGAHLTMPQSLAYHKSVLATVSTDISDPLSLVTSLFYDATGQIVRALSPTIGGTRLETRYAYDAKGNVTQVTDPRGNVVTYAYDANGNRILDRDAAGNTITRFYGASNQLLTESVFTVPDPDGAGPALPGNPLTTRYVYDTATHLRFVVSAEGRVAEYRYNAAGQRTAAIQYTGSFYPIAGLQPQDTLAEAQLTAWVSTSVDRTKSVRIDTSYDFRGQVGSTTRYDSVDAGGNGLPGTGSTTQYIYDQAGNLLKTIDPRGTPTAAANDYATAYAYDGLGRRTSTTVYDDQGLPLATVDSLGRTSVTLYDDAGKRTVLTSANARRTVSIYDASGELVSVVQSAGGPTLGTTSFVYDADGRLRRTVDPDGISTHILYDAAGRKVATVDGTGSLTEYRYDRDNNLARTIEYATALTPAQLASLVNAQGNPSDVALDTTPAGTGVRPASSARDRNSWSAYDSANRLVKSVDALGFVTQYFYDGAGRVTDTVRFARPISTASLGDTPAPSDINPASDPTDRLTRSFYDADGKLRGTLDAEGFITEHKYDAAGELVETVNYATPTNPSLRTTGTLAQLIPGASADDIHSHTLYNARGQVVGVVDGEGYLTESSYDAAGNKSNVIRYANKVAYTDGATLASLRPAGSAHDESFAYTYTALNQLSSETNPLGTRTQYLYDNVGNLVQTVVAQNTADARTLTAQYDAQGRRTQEKVDPNGLNLTTSYTYDADGLRTSATDRNGNKTIFYYDADGHLTDTITALGEVTENRHNALGQITARIAYANRLATLAGLNGGLVTTALTTAVGGIANAALDSTTTYTYDLHGQVATATDALAQSTTNYTYDTDGDLVEKIEAVGKPEVRITRYVYDRVDRLAYTIDASGGVVKNEYDAEGRLTKTTSYTTALSNFAALPAVPTASDVLQRLTTSPNDQVLTHVYDHYGRELYTVDALGGVTQRVYDAAGNVIQRIGYARNLSPGTPVTPAAVAALSDPTRDDNARMVYDTDNRLVYTVDALGEVTRNDYDARNNLTRTTTYATALTPAQLAGLGSSPSVAGVQLLVTANAASDQVVQQVFDLDDRLVYKIDALGFVEKNDFDALGQVIRTTGYAQAIPAGTAATLSGVAAALAANANRVGVRGLNLPGVSGNNASTLDTAANSVTGDIDIRVLAAPDSWSTSTGMLISKDDGAALHTDYGLRLLQGKLGLVVNVNGLSPLPQRLGALSTVTTGFSDGTAHWIRATRNASTGAVTFYTSDSYDPSTGQGPWTQIGATVSTGAGIVQGAIQDVGSNLRLGDSNLFGSTPFKGKVYYAEVRNGIDGTAVAKFNPVNAGDTNAQNFVSSTGETWTLAGGATLDSPSLTENQVDTFAYDAEGRLISHVDAQGDITRRDYDARGNLTQEVVYANKVQGTLVPGVAPQVLSAPPTVPPSGSYVITDSHDEASRYVYDPDNRLVYKIDAVGFVDKTDYDALGQVIHTTRYAQPTAIPLSTPLTLAVVAAAVAASAIPPAIRALNLSGAIGGYASTPDSATNSVTGDLDVRVQAAAADWTPATDYTHLIGKWDGAGGAGVSWYLAVRSTGALYLQWVDSGGSYHNALSTVVTNFADGAKKWVRATLDVDNGAGGNTVTFYTSDNGVDWTQFGAAVTASGVTSIADSAGAVTVGTRDHGIAGLFAGKIYYADFRNGISGPIAAKFNPADIGESEAPSFVSSNGETWTLAGSAAIDAPTFAEHQADFAYDAAGHLVYQVDGAGEVTRNDYDGAGDLIRTTDYATPVSVASLGTTPTLGSIQSRVTATALDHVEQRVVDAAGRVIVDIDAGGYVTQFKYDGNGNVVQKIRYATRGAFQGVTYLGQVALPQITVSALDQATSTVYDAANRPVFLIDAAGFVTQRFYDAKGNLVKEVQYANPVQLGTLTPGVAPQVVPSPSGDRTARYFYDNDGHVRFSVDAMGYVTERRYDGFGQEIKRIAYADRATVTDGTTLADFVTLVPTTTLANAVVTETHYDNAGRVLDSIDGNGVVTRSTYDAFGNATDKIEALGRPETRTTHTVYDALNRVTEQTTAYGTADASTKRFVLDAFGNEVAYIDPRGVALAESDSDWAKGERQRLGYSATAAGLSTSDKAYLRALYTTIQAFDGVNRKLASTDPLGNTTRTDYDAFGNAVRAIDPNGNAGYLYYDLRNLQVAQVDPEGDLTEYGYDAFGNKTTTIRYAIPVSVPYDPSRPLDQLRPKGVTLPGISGSYFSTPDSQANSVTGDIDMRVLLTHDSWAPATAEEFITKDDLATNRDYGFRFNSGSTGKLQFVASPDGVTTFPDANGITGGYSVVSTAATGFAPGSTHWVRVTRSASTGQITFYTSDDYDPNANTGTWTQLGDTISAPTGAIHDGTSMLQVGSRNSATDPLPFKGTIYYADVRNGIDALAPVAKFDPSASALNVAGGFTSSTGETWSRSGTASITAGSPPDQMTTTTYDALNRVTQVVDAEQHAESFTYDRNTSNVSSHADKNSKVTTYDYDAVGNKTAEHLPIASAGVPVVNRFEYDARGNRTKATLAQGLPEERVTQYVYDNDNRLTKTIEPQVLTQQTSAPAPAGSLQVGQPGTATYAFVEFLGTQGLVRVDVSWSPILGFDGSTTKVVWKTGTSLGDLTQIVGAQATSASVSYQGSVPLLAQNDVYEVAIYKQTIDGDVLITRAAGSYPPGLPNPPDPIDARSQVPNVLFTGQPLAGRTMHLAYWPASDPNDVTEIDFKNVASGTFLGTTPSVLSGTYNYEGKVFDANGDTLNSVTGTFSVASGTITTTIQAQPFTANAGVLQTPNTLRAYDAVGNLIRETDANGFAGGYAAYNFYDANNRLIGTVDAERYLRRYFYDPAGNLTAQRTYGDAILGTAALTTLPDPATIAGMDPNNYREMDYRYSADNQQIETDTRPVLVYDRTYGLRPQGVPLVTARQYDRDGNLVLEVDANGNKTYSYYDRAGRKIAQADVQLDASYYLSTWTYDAAGNMIRKTRYAAALTGPLSTGSNPLVLAAQAAAANNHDDRICLYAYDRMNRMVRETTLGVDIATVDGSAGAPGTGVATEQITNVVVQQRYDNAGNLLAKIQDTAETDYSYDGLNRLYQEVDPQFADFNGAPVRSTKIFTYDGVGNIRQVNENGSITSYAYDPHGNLTRSVDPVGNATRYYYDLNGNVTVKHTRHINPDGTAPGVDTVYTYDKLNRQTSSTETKNFTYYTKYDAYGEIVEKGLNNLAQEYEQYDRAGRLVKTNKDDGVDRAYLYDANGNATAKIQSAVQDIDLRAMTIDQIAALPVSAVQRKESAYDARNQLIGVFEAPIAAAPTDANAQEVWVDALSDPLLGGSITPVDGSTVNYTFTQTVDQYDLGYSVYPIGIRSSLSITMPPIVGYGDGDIKVVWDTDSQALGTLTKIFDKNTTSFQIAGATGQSYLDAPYYSAWLALNNYTVTIYKVTPQADIRIASVSGIYSWINSGLYTGVTNALSTRPSVIEFTGQRADAQSMNLWLWPVGGSKSSSVSVPMQVGPDNTPIRGSFIFDWSNSAVYPPGDYNYEYQTLDAQSKVLEHVKGTVRLGGSSGSSLLTKLVGTWQVPTSGLSTAAQIYVGRMQSYNAFGQVFQELDANLDANGNHHVTTLKYNTRGDLIEKVDPAANATEENGALTTGFLPTTRYYYDYLGRAVGTRDAASAPNTVGNQYTKAYDAAGHLLFEYNPGQRGYKTYRYDVSGNLRYSMGEVGWPDTYTYDAKNQLTRVDHQTSTDFGNAQRFDLYSYDEEGRRISHTDALGASELTFFDSTGKVTRTTSAAGVTTLFRYVFDPVGKGTRSVTLEQTAEGAKTTQDTKDYFGRLLQHVDLGGHQYFYTYNKAGWLIQQLGDTNLANPGNEQNIVFSYYQNGLLRQTIDNALNTRTGYEYDRNGNATFEGYAQVGTKGVAYYQSERVRYDALNRVTHIDDGSFTIDYEYDRNGNRRHIYANYRNGLNGTSQTQDYWYKYDAMNRFTVTQGQLLDAAGNPITTQDPATRQTGTIGMGTTGTEVFYDNASERTTTNYWSGGRKLQDIYQYADGLLTNTNIVDVTNPASVPSVGSAHRAYDAVGRVVSYSENGSAGSRNATYSYARDGRIAQEVGSANGTTTYFYDAAGTLRQTQNQQGATTINTLYSYEYWDAPKQSKIQIYATNPNAPNWKPGFSNFSYDVNGHLVQMNDYGPDGAQGGTDDRYLHYALDARGQVLQRYEVTGTTASKTQSYYYLNGVGIGDSGFTASKTDYASVLASRDKNLKTAEPISSADFGSNYMPINDRYPATTPGAYTIQQGELGATYDETLRNVALAVWGDGSLWYILADANGLPAGSSNLVAGQTVIVPNVVTNIHNNAGTFKVYDPGEAMGDTSPTLPDPPPPPPASRDGGCGAMGIIIIVIVAIVVTIATSGATSEMLPELFATVGETAVETTTVTGLEIAGDVAEEAAIEASIGGTGLEVATPSIWEAGLTALSGEGGLAGLAGAVVGGAAGSAAGQLTAMALGMQKHFSWKQVGMGAVGAGVTAGIGAYAGEAGGLANEFKIAGFLGRDGSLAFNAMAANLATQGLGKATGWQEHFSWRSAAVSALAAPIAARVSDFISTTTDYDPASGTAYKRASDFSRWAGDFGTRLTTSFVNGVATQAIRRRVYDTGGPLDYGQIAADAFGNTIGQSLAAQLAKEGAQPAAITALREQEPTVQAPGASAGAAGWRNVSRDGIEMYSDRLSDMISGRDSQAPDLDPQAFAKGPYVLGENGGDFYPVYTTPIHNAITEDVLGSRLGQYLGDVFDATNHIDRPFSPYQKSDASFIHFMTGVELPDPTAAKWNPNVENAPEDLQTPVGMETRRVAERAFQIFRSEYDGDLSPEARERYRHLELPEQQQISARLTNSWVRAAFELSQANMDAGTPESIRNANYDFGAALHPMQETSLTHQGGLWTGNPAEWTPHLNGDTYNPGPDSAAYRNTEDMYKYFFVDRKLPSTLDFSKSIPLDLPPQIENPPGVQTTPGGAVTRIPRRRL